MSTKKAEPSISKDTIKFGVLTLPQTNKPASAYVWENKAEAENQAHQIAESNHCPVVVMEMRPVSVFRVGTIVKDTFEAAAVKPIAKMRAARKARNK